jgi:aminoglycoside 6'-N-acetyltransferase-1b
MEEADLPLLHSWLQQPHVLEWWGNENLTILESVREKYLPRIQEPYHVRPLIALRGGHPIGYCQSYVVCDHGDGWWEGETDRGARGCDQFIGDASLLGQGIGTQLVQALLAYIFTDPAVTKVQTDPAPDNARAIRCYEKAGFRSRGIVNTPDGPELLMVVTRAEFDLISHS